MVFQCLRRPCVSLLSVPVLLSCGGPPTRPDDSAVTLTILSPADAIRVSASVDMTLMVVFGNGRQTVITPRWTTDRPDIVSVKPLSASRQTQAGEEWEGDKTGTIDHMLFARVTGLSPGEAHVIADSSYGTATRPIRVTAQ